jgi:hypothetical protein
MVSTGRHSAMHDGAVDVAAAVVVAVVALGRECSGLRTGFVLRKPASVETASGGTGPSPVMLGFDPARPAASH